MGKRRAISKTVRFEVFKRDAFTCQYCGAKAPDVILQLDHVRPVAEGGDDDPLNLVTACRDCNAGKGARTLDDKSSLNAQRAQLDELQERREQLDMMVSWRHGLSRLEADTVAQVEAFIGEKGGFGLSESGKSDVKKWLKKHKVSDVLAAVDEAFTAYIEYLNDEPTSESFEKAFSKIGAFLTIQKQEKEKPYIRRLLYIQGILRKRCRHARMHCIDALEEFVLDGAHLDELERIAKSVDTWEEFCEFAEDVVDPDCR